MNIVLYQPQIPPNTGNIARLCVATGSVLHLIRPLGFSTDDAQLKRAGLDYWEFLKIFYHEGWQAFLEARDRARQPPAPPHGGVRPYRGAMHFYSKKAAAPYTRPQYKEGDYLIFGSETEGLPEEIMRNYAANLFTIPMWGPTRSLNLSTSVGIVLYESLRQVRGGF